MLMYFKSRAEAGQQLAGELMNLQYDDIVVMALSDGAAIVGQAMVEVLGGGLTLLLTKDITLPGELSVVGTLDQSGGFTYNHMFSTGELEEYEGEFHNYFEAEKMSKVSEINHLLSHNGLIERQGLRDKIVIVTSDGAKTGVAFDAAANYLKPVRLKRLIMVAPVASVDAVDRLHILGDEIHVLSTVDNYLDTDHYYDQNNIPNSEAILQLLSAYPISEQSVARPERRTYT